MWFKYNLFSMIKQTLAETQTDQAVQSSARENDIENKLNDKPGPVPAQNTIVSLGVARQLSTQSKILNEVLIEEAKGPEVDAIPANELQPSPRIQGRVQGD